MWLWDWDSSETQEEERPSRKPVPEDLCGTADVENSVRIVNCTV
jgi:hypothetical protein